MLPSSTFVYLCAATTVMALFVPPARAQKHDPAAHAPAAAGATIKTEIVSLIPAAQNAAPVVIRLTDEKGNPVTLADLKVAHTEKLHLLVVDETLSDYHHEHPVPAQKPGEYRFDFEPRYGGVYHLWADIVPVSTGKQEYSKATLRIEGAAAAATQTINIIAEADGYRFEMSFEKNEPLRVGKASLAKVKVTRGGSDFAQLEPVMGAFAHMVAFPADLQSVAHVHPMGKEPEKNSERGGPMLSFHIAPEKPGYHKIFLQTQIAGREVYAAFGLNVEPATPGSAGPQGGYVCPMHPDVKQKSPGKCPKCGMELVPVQKEPAKS